MKLFITQGPDANLVRYTHLIYQLTITNHDDSTSWSQSYTEDSAIYLHQFLYCNVGMLESKVVKAADDGQ